MRNLFLVLLSFMVFTANANAEDVRIRCASTTSTQNSGLFDYILPLFEAKTDIKVDVVAVGTGAAIEIGKRGDADVVFVHAKSLELKSVEEGYFVDRHDVMYNDFVLIGPPLDPAGIKGMTSVTGAFGRIAGQGASFVSRGDKSGTHTKELSIWKKTGFEPRGNSWYMEVGQGMAKTQRIANEKRAYTLTDRGTWLAAKDADQLDMTIVLGGDPELFNQYGVMAVNPKKQPHVKFKEAMEFVNWLISTEGQEAIGSFRDRKGNRLFTPNAR